MTLVKMGAITGQLVFAYRYATIVATDLFFPAVQEADVSYATFSDERIDFNTTLEHIPE